MKDPGERLGSRGLTDLEGVDMSNATSQGYSSTFEHRLFSRCVLMPSGCLEFQGARSTSGYGHIGRGARGAGYEITHRAAWILANGPIPDGLWVLHHCDNPPCCNVEHLFLGTVTDNVADMWTKGRQCGQLPAGSNHPSARLTDEDVATLRALAPSVANHAELGRMFGITKQHARALVLNTKRVA